MNPLWIRQIRGMMRMEIKKNLLSRRAIPIYVLAAIPVGIASMIFLISMIAGRPGEFDASGSAAVFFAVIYKTGILRFVIFFGCVVTFMNLFRGEILDRSLHYYFLSPIRREVLVAGKFVSGWVSTTVVFVLATWVSNTILFFTMGFGPAMEYFFSPTGIGHMLGYAGVTALACLGYGAVFLLLGMFFRNPVIPAIVLFVWEGINPFLPSLLKKISVVYYVESLVPVKFNVAEFQILADPAPLWLALPGILLVTALVLFVSGLRVRHMEIDYGQD
jgi:ABC-type transport system involved in multi-copper enzyme maturation permease subunit